jgi:hypothetical protein
VPDEEDVMAIRRATSMRRLLALSLTLIAAAALAGAEQHGGQAGRGMAGRHGMHDDAHMADMQGIRALFAARTQITRTVTVRADGVETVTESDDPAVARLIKQHVAAMYARVEHARPIHQRDPLFRELFAHAAQIEMRQAATARGVRVLETSPDPYVARLIQAHADVVSAFLANGHAEMMKNHPVPPRPH